jgi:hypothetical protein
MPNVSPAAVVDAAIDRCHGHCAHLVNDDKLAQELIVAGSVAQMPRATVTGPSMTRD